MKAINLLTFAAVPAICISLNSCSRDYNGYLEAATNISKDAAEELNACNSIEDADDTADAIVKLAKKMEELYKDYGINYQDKQLAEIFDPEKSEEAQRLAMEVKKKEMLAVQKAYQISNTHWEAALKRISDHEQLRKHNYLNYAINRFNRAYGKFCKNGNIF